MNESVTPQCCPECGARAVARIVYGLPRFSDDLYEQMVHGRVVLGGMRPPADAPVWMCLDGEAGWKNSSAAAQFILRVNV